MSAAAKLRLGTRRSALAMRQARLVADAVRARTGRQVELVEVVTEGDLSGEPLAQIGGTGVFVSAIRAALLRGEVDFAVHSLKDLPTADAPGLVLSAIPAREDPRDVLVAREGRTLATLPRGARIGTGSPRRAGQLAALGRDFDVLPVRGNVDTRLRLVAERALDAVVLARAGLARLGRLDAVSEVIDPRQIMPAPGQGALAIEALTADAAMVALLAALDHPATRAAVTAERALLAALEVGCSAPVGALAELIGLDSRPEIHLRAVVMTADGRAGLRMSTTGPVDDAVGVGRRLAAELVAHGAADLMGEHVS